MQSPNQNQILNRHSHAGSVHSLTLRITPFGGWLILLAITLLTMFETQIRNPSSQAESVSAIPILPGFWLSDLGLILPILLVIANRPWLSKLRSNRLLMIYSLIVVYGIMMGLARGNAFSNITNEFRISLALVTGICLMTMAPRQLTSISIGLLVTSFAAIVYSSWVLLNSPSIVLLAFQRGVSEPTFFIMSGVSLCLLAPNILLAHLLDRRSSIVLAWVTVGLILYSAVAIAQTRTLSFAIMLAIMLSVFGVVALGRIRRARNAMRRSWTWIILFGIGVSVVFVSQSQYVANFINRVQMQGSEQDINWLARLDEAQVALDTMQGVDHVIGQGLGTQSQAITMTTDVAKILHLGVLNIWWRFGLPAFVLFLLMLLRLGMRYALVLFRALMGKFPRRGLALFVCAPGILTLALISFFSGGWSISNMLSLGLLWGLYERLRMIDRNDLTIALITGKNNPSE